MTYAKQKEKWAKRRQAIYDAVKVKGREVKAVANAYGITDKRVYRIIDQVEKAK